jgi:hypothetical protein
MEVIRLSFVHPVSAVNQWRLDHLEFLSRNHRQSWIQMLDDKVLQFAIAKPYNSSDDVIITIGRSV